MINRMKECLWRVFPQKSQILRGLLVLLSIWFSASVLGFMEEVQRADYLWGFLAGFAIASCLWVAGVWSAREKVRGLLEQEFVMTLARGLEELSHRRRDRNLRSLVNHTTAVFKAVAPYLAPVRFWLRPRIYVLDILQRVKHVSLVDVVVREDELLVGLAPEDKEVEQ